MGAGGCSWIYSPKIKGELPARGECGLLVPAAGVRTKGRSGTGAVGRGDCQPSCIQITGVQSVCTVNSCLAITTFSTGMCCTFWLYCKSMYVHIFWCTQITGVQSVCTANGCLAITTFSTGMCCTFWMYCKSMYVHISLMHTDYWCTICLYVNCCLAITTFSTWLNAVHPGCTANRCRPMSITYFCRPNGTAPCLCNISASFEYLCYRTKASLWIYFNLSFLIQTSESGRVKAINHPMYVSVRFYFQLYSSCVYICNQRGAFWVEMCPAVRTQWITLLMKHVFTHRPTNKQTCTEKQKDNLPKCSIN